MIARLLEHLFGDWRIVADRVNAAFDAAADAEPATDEQVPA